MIFDDLSSEYINKCRAMFIHEVCKEKEVNLDIDDWMTALNDERILFKEQEKEAKPVFTRDRINRLTNFTLEDDVIENIFDYFSRAALLFLPRVNRKLVKKIKKWREEDKRIVLLSNTGMIDAETTRKILEKLKLCSYFDQILLSEEVGICKPDPMIFLEVSKRIKVPASRMLHIGDSMELDYKPALTAGCKALLLEEELIFNV